MLVQTQYRIYILLFIIFATVALLMSVCGKYWIHTNDLFSGLWETCTKLEEECKEVDTDVLYWILHVRRLMVIALALLTLALLYFIFLISSPKAFNSKILVFLLGLSGILAVVGMSVFTEYNSDSTNSYTYHWNFFMGWVGIVLTFIAAGMSVHDARRPESPFANAHRLK